MKDLGPDVNVDGDRGLSRRQHTSRADLLMEMGGVPRSHLPPPPLPGGTALRGQARSISTPVSPHTLSPVFISNPVPTLSPSLPSWAGALVTPGLSPLSWGQGEGPCAEVQCRGQERDADCLCDTNLLSDAHSRASAPRWVSQVTFWALHVGQGMGSPASPHGEPCAACSALTPGLCPHTRALPSPQGSAPALSPSAQSRNVGAGGLRGRQPCGGAWGLHRVGERKREKGELQPRASASSFLCWFSALRSSPSPACQGRMWGGTGAPVSLELESSPSFINMQISKF